MKSLIFFTLLSLVFYIATVQADCTDAASEGDGEFTAWVKNFGCKIKEGAIEVKDAAKPYAEKIGQSAKEFGNTVVQKYDDIKHKISDDSKEAATPAPIKVEPTEKVPLAPLGGNQPPSVVTGAATGEQNRNEDISEDEVTPESIDNRFLLQPHECPRGQAVDRHGHCRKEV